MTDLPLPTLIQDLLARRLRAMRKRLTESLPRGDVWENKNEQLTSLE